MKPILLNLLILALPLSLFAQQIQPLNLYQFNALYRKQLKTEQPAETENPNKPNDDEQARYNRWYHMLAVRAYPNGIDNHRDALLKAFQNQQASGAKNNLAKSTGNSIGPWKSIGPQFGIGRVNVVRLDPQNSNTIYIGSAGGGVWKSTDLGNSWTSNSDNFPSISIADIQINPIHTDTLFVATGDGYGYAVDSPYNLFWGGLYSAGVLMSPDGGNTWHTTGLSNVQSDTAVIQKLLLHPLKTYILLASTRVGIYRSTNSGTTWSLVDNRHAYAMAFKPGAPDTVYATTASDLLVSYNAGANWQVLNAGISVANNLQGSQQDRVSIAVSPASPNSIWLLGDNLLVSHDGGLSFTATTAPMSSFYGYYDKVLAVSPFDSNEIFANGMEMSQSTDGGISWTQYGYSALHVDHHAVCFDPNNANRIYAGCDGGVFVTNDHCLTWSQLSDSNLCISQIYRSASSRQDPSMLLCGLQDNNTLSCNAGTWNYVLGGDGMDCAIYPQDDNYQVASYQYGNFYLSSDQGVTFTPLNIGVGGYWTSPVSFVPNQINNIYFGLYGVFFTNDMGTTFTDLTPLDSFNHNLSWEVGVTSLKLAPSNSNVIYAADQSHIIKSTNAGLTWTNITGNLPSNTVAIIGIAVDYKNPALLYVCMSGYDATKKVFASNNGGLSWHNISYNLPNVPTAAIATDSSNPGALFLGTDMGMYYTDSTTPNTWAKYSVGLPNVIVDGIDINYTNRKVRAATYGRGLWECDLPQSSLAVQNINPTNTAINIYPNPIDRELIILGAINTNINVYDVLGRLIFSNTLTSKQESINTSTWAHGTYFVQLVYTNGNREIRKVEK